jgi:hypothetical protein
MKNIRKTCSAVLAVAGTLALVNAEATEGGGSNYPQGAESYLGAAVPPPGFYVLEYVCAYSANEFRDSEGRRLPVNFNAHVSIAATRLIWVSEQKLLGGQVMLHAIFPLINAGGSLNGTGGGDSGLGDMDVGVGLAYHASPKFHYGFAVDTFAPTGRYSKNELFNAGRNYWSMQSIAGFTYTQPRGPNADLKLMYNVNTRNHDTDYRSGNELHADYVLAWSFNPRFAAGIGGYFYHQTTDDRAPGLTVGNRGHALGIGPNFKYDNGKGWFLTAKYQQEYRVRNRPSGSGLYLKAVIPL